MNQIEIDKLLKENGLSEAEIIFKSNLKRLRLESPGNPTMREIASKIGIKYGTYRLMESMTPVNVKFETMDKIVHFYNIPLAELFVVK